MTNMNPRLGTLAVWAGEEEYLLQGATQVPVVHSVSFGYDDVAQWLRVALGQEPGHIYSRNTNPTVHAFEEKIRILEGADAATSAATGMGIISSTLFTFLSPGDRIVSVKDTYGGTNVIFTEFLPRFQVDVALCDTTDHEAIEAEVAKGCKVLYLETPTNPPPSRSSIWPDWPKLAKRPGPSSSSITPSPHRSTRILCNWVRIWCCTARPNIWADTPTLWAGSSAAQKH